MYQGTRSKASAARLSQDQDKLDTTYDDDIASDSPPIASMSF